MKCIGYIKNNVGMNTSDFMREWKAMTDADKDWYRDAAREEMATLGIECED